MQVCRGGRRSPYDLGFQPREFKKKLTDNQFLTAPRIWKPNNGSFYHSYQYVVEIRICGGRDPLFSITDLAWSCSFLALTSFDLTNFFLRLKFFAGRCCRLLDKHWLPLKKRLLSQHTYAVWQQLNIIYPCIYLCKIEFFKLLIKYDNDWLISLLWKLIR